MPSRVQRKQKAPEAAPDFLTISAAADYLGVSGATLRNWDRAGKLRPHRHPMSRYRMYAREDLEIMLKAGVRRERRGPGRADNISWDDLADEDHFVLFYAEERYLIDSVSSFVGRALNANEVAVVIATPDHRARLRRKLKTAGFDMAQALANGQFVAIDAQTLLDEVMVDGLPDPARFEKLAGGLVDSLSPRGKVRGFGEMVSMLWRAGNKKGALQLEDLWNSLGRDRSFVAFCAYPVDGFDGDDPAAQFADVCSRHKRVLTAESFPGQLANDAQRRAIADLQQKAQSALSERARRERAESEIEDLALDAHDGLIKIGADGTITWANPAALGLLGYARDQYVGHDIREFHADAGSVTAMLDHLRSGDEVVSVSAAIRCAADR